MSVITTTSAGHGGPNGSPRAAGLMTSASIRATNRASIVDVLRRRGHATQADIIRSTGLSRSTVSSVLGELDARGLLTEQVDHDAPARGRRPTLIGLNRNAGLGIGIDIGARHLAVAIGDMSRAVHGERWWTSADGSGFGVDALVARIRRTMREAQADPDLILGAGVSVATPVPPSRSAAQAPCLIGGVEAGLAAELADALGVPVTVENDAACGLLSELTWGGAVHAETVAYVKWSSRVGCGMGLNGTVFRGATGFAGEIGHLTIDRAGPTCWCGSRGCLELYCGGDRILRRLDEFGCRVSDLDDVVAAVEAGDERAAAVVSDATTTLATGLAHLVHLVNPSRIVIGGQLSRLGERILRPLRDELRALSFVARDSGVQVETAQLGPRASLFGALAMVLTEQRSDMSSGYLRPPARTPA